MAKYIDREKLIAEYDRVHEGQPGGARKLMVEALAADVVEVKHGYWKRTEEPLGWQEVTLAECSVCGEGWLTDDNFSIEEFVDYWHYCPNCGAKMDLKEGAEE